MSKRINGSTFSMTSNGFTPYMSSIMSGSLSGASSAQAGSSAYAPPTVILAYTLLVCSVASFDSAWCCCCKGSTASYWCLVGLEVVVLWRGLLSYLAPKKVFGCYCRYLSVKVPVAKCAPFYLEWIIWQRLGRIWIIRKSLRCLSWILWFE